MKTEVHVIPLNDLREHEETEDCWCQPLVGQEADGKTMVIHHALDLREKWERQGIKQPGKDWLTVRLETEL